MIPDAGKYQVPQSIWNAAYLAGYRSALVTFERELYRSGYGDIAYAVCRIKYTDLINVLGD